MYFKSDWAESQKRFEALWHQELIDRCCVAVFAPKAGHEEAYYKGVNLRSTLHGYDPEYVMEQKEKHLEHCFFGGEAFPELWFNYGPAGHAGYFDAPIDIRDGHFWLGSVIEDYDAHPLVFREDHPLLQHQELLCSHISQKCQDRFMISTPDNAGMLDALSTLRGADNLLMDFYDDPDNVHKALDELFHAWNYSGQRLYELCKNCNYGGSVVGWLSLWAPNRMSQLQSDISVMLSSSTFREFELPELIRCANEQDYNIYHMDGIEQLRHLDDILSIDKIQMIQWVSVAGQPNYMHHFDVFKKIQESGKSVLINEVDPKDIKTLLSELSSKGLFLVTKTESQADAEDLVESVKRWTRE